MSSKYAILDGLRDPDAAFTESAAARDTRTCWKCGEDGMDRRDVATFSFCLPIKGERDRNAWYFVPVCYGCLHDLHLLSYRETLDGRKRPRAAVHVIDAEPEPEATLHDDSEPVSVEVSEDGQPQTTLFPTPDPDPTAADVARALLPDRFAALADQTYAQLGARALFRRRLASALRKHPQVTVDQFVALIVEFDIAPAFERQIREDWQKVLDES